MALPLARNSPLRNPRLRWFGRHGGSVPCSGYSPGSHNWLIKVLASHLSSSPELKQRMEREAKAISSLTIPHCHLYDIGSEDGTDYLVMEFLEGETLAERLRKGAIPERNLQSWGAVPNAGICPPQWRCAPRSKARNIMLTQGGRS